MRDFSTASVEKDEFSRQCMFNCNGGSAGWDHIVAKYFFFFIRRGKKQIHYPLCVTRHENTFKTIGVGFCVCVRSTYWENRWASIMPGYSIVDSDATALPSPPKPSRKRICLSPSIMIYLRVETWLILSFCLVLFFSSSALLCCISLKVTPELSRGHFFLIFPLTDWVSGFAQAEGKTASRDRYRFFSRGIQYTARLNHQLSRGGGGGRSLRKEDIVSSDKKYHSEYKFETWEYPAVPGWVSPWEIVNI